VSADGTEVERTMKETHGAVSENAMTAPISGSTLDVSKLDDRGYHV
jgi:hypothetical protein